MVVAIDGRSGAGKSTLAAALAGALGRQGLVVTIVEGDDFYGGGSAATWDGRTASANVDEVIDWRRQRALVADLRTRGAGEWRPFDWESDDWDGDGAPLGHPVGVEAGDVVILEGAYSCRPELADLLDLRVLLQVPDERRRRQLREREGDDVRDDWEARWSAAEEHYFGTVLPPDWFDVVLAVP